MSKIRVSFVADVPYGQVAAAGAFVLDIATQTFSDVSVVCTGGHPVAPKVSAAQFAPPPSNYPAGTPTLVNIGDPKGVRVQINYHDHAFTDRPIPITGGFVEGVPFDILNVPGGMGGRGWVVVTPVP